MGYEAGVAGRGDVARAEAGAIGEAAVTAGAVVGTVAEVAWQRCSP